MKTDSHDRDVPVATRIDAVTGTTERAELRGREGDRIYSFAYSPGSHPRGVVLICPPLHAEFTRNYRREVLLARRLVVEGFSVERFHYRHTGNSDGDGGALTFDSMREDVLECAEHVLAQAPDAPFFLVGTRLGALIAASAGAGKPEWGLVAWEPVLDVSRFFKDAFRTRLVHERKSGVEQPATSAELNRRLHSGQSVDVVGHTIDRGLFESLGGRTMDGELGTSPRTLLVLQIGASAATRPDLAAGADRWRAAGMHVDVQTVQGDEAWWLIDDRWHDEGKRPMTNRLIELTTAWITARTGERELA